MARVARHLTIRGRVQGVFFRGWTVEQARRLGLAGWVRNRRDGSVEAVVQGAEAAVEQFIELAQRGPAHARVEGIESTDAEVDTRLEGFSQYPMA